MSDRFGKISIDPVTPAIPAVEPPQKPLPPLSPKTSKVKKQSSHRRRNGAFIWLASLGILFGLYNLIGFFAVPYYLKTFLTEKFNKDSGMILTVGSIAFNPLTFHFSVTHTKIASTTDDSSLVDLETLSADLAPFSLLRMDLVCNTVTLSDLILNITREENGSYNFAKLIQQKKEGGGSEILNFSDLPFLFSLNNIALNNGKILFLDLPTGKTHTMEKIRLDLPTFSNIPFQANQYLQPRFSAIINGSPVELTGQAQLGDAPNEVTTLSCSLHALDLPLYAEYLPFNLPLLFTGGKAEGKIDLLFNPTSVQDDRLSLSFEFQLTETDLQSVDETVFISSPATEVKGKLQPLAKTVVFSKISSHNPVVQSVGPSLLSSFETLFKKDKKDLPNNKILETPATSPANFSLAIEELLIKEGTFHFWKDKDAKQPETTWDNLLVTVNKYSSIDSSEEKKEAGSFSISGGKPETSTFTWQGNLTSLKHLEGTLRLNKKTFKELLLTLGAYQDLDVTGTADLNGYLSITFPEDSKATLGFNLSKAEIVVEDFQLLDDKIAVLSAPFLHISSLATAYKTIHFGNISIENGAVILPLARIPDVFKQFVAGKYLVQNIDFTGSTTLVFDAKGKKKSVYQDISLKAKDLDSPEKAKDNFSLSATTAGEGKIEGHGDLRIAPFSLNVEAEFRSLPAIEVFPVLTNSSLLNSLSGTLAGKGSLSFPKKSFSGELQLTRTTLRQSADSLFAWSDMLLHDVNYTSEPFHIGFTQAIITEPQFTWQIHSNDSSPMHQFASFLQQHLDPPGNHTPPENETTKVTSPSVDIKEIQLHKGKILIHDTRLKPAWKEEITDFSGTLTNIQSTTPGINSPFSFSGKLQESPFTLNGEMDVFLKEENGKFHMNLDECPLALFQKQLAPMTDIDLSSGSFNLLFDGAVQNDSFKNSGTLSFSQVKSLSLKSDTALALALLTDQDEGFQLNFDFARTAPLGKTIFLEEILSFFQTKVVKASVSPMLLASGDFSDLIGNESAEFEPGKTTLTDKGREVVARYAILLATHPRLGLELSNGLDKDIDAPAIKEHLEIQEQIRVEGENQKRFAAWQEEKALFDQKVAEQQKKSAGKVKPPSDLSNQPAMLKEYIPLQAKKININDTMLLDLAKNRSQWLSQYLIEQLAIAPERLTIIPLKKISSSQSEQAATGTKLSLTAMK